MPVADEIEQLEDLIAEAVGQPATANADDPATRPTTEPKPFDFRRPSSFSRDDLRAVHLMGETLARQLSSVVSTTLRVVCQVQLARTDQLTYDEYIDATPNPCYLAILGVAPLAGAGMFSLPLPLSLAVVERLLGAVRTSGDQPARPLTEIEATLVRSLVDRSLGELSSAFEGLADITFHVVRQEANPQFAQTAAPTDTVTALTFRMRIGEAEGHATLCLPVSVVHALLDRMMGGAAATPNGARDNAASAHALSGALLDVPVEVHVRFRDVPLLSRDILRLAVGDVVPLRHPMNEPLRVHAGSTPVLPALPGRRGPRMACVIVDPQESAR